MIIAMAGQPNSGKSTIFNHVAGYKTITSNFPGKTVEYTESKVTISGEVHTLIDLPGTYSLTSLDPAELEARNYLLRRHADVTINVVDASLLARSIELTIQLSELEVPYILVLNMMDEARKKGVTIDKDRLSRELGVPVVEAVANKGVGITQALEAAIGHAKNLSEQHIVRYSKHVEDAIIALMPHIEGHAKAHGLPPRLFALKLLEADPHFEELVPDSIMEDVVLPAREVLEEDHGHPSDVVISSERHAQALNIFERVAHVATAVKTLSERLDGFLMHPVYGYAALIVILYAFFNIIFRAGNALEPPIMDFFSNEVEPAILSYIPEGFASTAVTGIIQGIAGGIGIVLPYLFPFLVGLSVLEDLGYLPRIAFLLDSFLHKIGLHGKSIIPFILGYGCSVPAIMGARILESRRDRFIVITLTSMIPCAARITVILALVGVFLGGNWALFVFLFNIAVIALVGYILSRLMPEDIPGMMLEIPSYHRPSLKVVLNKTWFRMKEFIVVAWPIIIAGSLSLSVLEYLDWVSYINTAFSPLTVLLGLPVVVGTTLVFGVLRKELAMLMLFQALGTDVVLDVMTKTQIMTFTMFIIFYVPCVATIGVMVRELGKRDTVLAVGIGLVVATVVGVLTRIAGAVV
jgi:ferrous iron transport protein B